MSPDRPIGGERNPETGAITGGAPPAAEPPPQTRGRRSSLVGAVWVFAIAGIALVLTALVAGQDTGPAIGTAVLGVVLLAVAGLSMAGVIGPPERAGIGLAVAAALSVLAFAVSQPGLARGAYIACAAGLLMAGFAALAASRRGAPGGEGEPSPGVRNV